MKEILPSFLLLTDPSNASILPDLELIEEVADSLIQFIHCWQYTDP